MIKFIEMSQCFFFPFERQVVSSLKASAPFSLRFKDIFLLKVIILYIADQLASSAVLPVFHSVNTVFRMNWQRQDSNIPKKTPKKQKLNLIQ